MVSPRLDPYVPIRRVLKPQWNGVVTVNPVGWVRAVSGDVVGMSMDFVGSPDAQDLLRTVASYSR